MKKILIIAALALGFAAAVSAQPRAAGVRFAYGAEASYQHSVNYADFIEANLGIFGFGSLNATATYNFMIAQPDWTSRGEWGFYAGPGASLGFVLPAENQPGVFSIAAVGQVGLEYSFWFPLQLSIDLRPQLGLACYKEGAKFYNGGLLGVIPTLGVRYRF